MPYGTHKLLGAASTAAAWKDWHALESWCVQNGHGERAGEHAPQEGAGHKTIEKKIEKLRVALGAPAGAWENVLDGLTDHQQPLPPGVRPIVEGELATGDLTKANEALHRLAGVKTTVQVAEGWAAKTQAPPADPPQREQQQPAPQLRPAEPRPSPSAEGHGYTQRVYQAYRDLAKEYRSPDVRIDALHSRLGGSLQDLHRWLRQACRDHLAVPSTGEPALADHAARQSALTLPGESDSATGKPQSFLLIKLIDPPTMSQEQTPKEQPQPKFELPSPVEQYEYHLRQLAALKYPDEERTAELEARIEKTIQHKVGDFLHEQQHRERVRLYENSLRRQLAEKHPNLTPDQAKHYERRINELVAQFRQNQTQQQPQQAPPLPARSQPQGRGLEPSL